MGFGVVWRYAFDMPAWNGWYHLMSNTYGTWLPGDPRGFRTRGHREHVEGDYKRPPGEDYTARHEAAKRWMTREPVWLSVEARRAGLAALHHAMVDVHGLEVLSLAVSAVHLHVLVRLPGDLRRKPTLSKRGLRGSSVDDPPRHYLGIAKKESAKALAKAGLVEPGGVWATRGKVRPIRDRQHQVNVFHYILDHRREGAAVWSFKDGASKKKPML